jgi:hypothetical protein
MLGAVIPSAKQKSACRPHRLRLRTRLFLPTGRPESSTLTILLTETPWLGWTALIRWRGRWYMGAAESFSPDALRLTSPDRDRLIPYSEIELSGIPL